MHDVAAYLVRRDHRLAGEIRDLLERELAAGPMLGGEELPTASAWLDGSTLSADGERARRLGQLKIALDAALADWLADSGRQISRATTATTGRASAYGGAVTTGSSPVSSTRRTRPR